MISVRWSPKSPCLLFPKFPKFQGFSTQAKNRKTLIYQSSQLGVWQKCSCVSSFRGVNNPLHVGTPLAQIVRSVRGVEDVCDLNTRLVFSSHVHPQPHPHAFDCKRYCISEFRKAPGNETSDIAFSRTCCYPKLIGVLMCTPRSTFASLSLVLRYGCKCYAKSTTRCGCKCYAKSTTNCEDSDCCAW